jgi:hypothetical protein
MMAESWNARFAKALENEDWIKLSALAQEARAGAAWWQAKAEDRDEEIHHLRGQIEWLQHQIETSQESVPVVAGEID